MARQILLVAAIVVVVVAGAQATVHTPVTINAPTGPITGYENGLARVFRGIPYALPPVNELRWTSPQAKPAWSQPYLADTDAPGCPQPGGLPPFATPPVTSEDCLYLNVFTPLNATETSNLPVMVFIHGGTFKNGYAGGLLYDSTNFANYTNTIIVLIQYRLGILGFLWTGTDITGNYGLQDQRLALRWVQKNIAAFGGDPGLVTVFGQSAGAMSIASHLVSPASVGLFKHAIMESEPFALQFRSAETWPPAANAFAQYVGCQVNDTACLKAVNVSVVMKAQHKVAHDIFASIQDILMVFVPWTPTVGTDELPMQPYDAFVAGMAQDIPIIAGTVQNEAMGYIYGAFSAALPAEELYIAADVIFGAADGEKVIQRFPIPADQLDDARNFTAKIATEALFVCPTRNATRTAARNSPVYLYHYDHVIVDGEQAWGPGASYCWQRVCHAAELPFVFLPNATAANVTFTPEEVEMGHSIQRYWTNFARTGSPGSGSLTNPVEWPLFNDSLNTMLLQTPANQILQAPGNVSCSFWDTIGYAWY